jgi:hypothetical protein
MFVARWQFTSQFGKVNDVLSILRKWEIDVGERVGWKTGHLRVVSGVVGAGNSDVELEVRVDAISDLEAAWGDMERNPHHHEHMKQLGHVLVGGTAKWTIYREVNLFPTEG